MKQWFSIVFNLLILIGCNSNPSKKETIATTTTKFTLNGTIENSSATKVYLNKLIENSVYSIDSAEIKNNQFILDGTVEYPERFAITFNNSSAIAVLIIENTAMKVRIDANNAFDPIVEGSILNDELAAYKSASKTIFRKIDYLYPHFQKARLENDVKKLDEIKLEMKKTEAEYKKFSFDFIEKHKNSYIAPILLSDQLKNTEIDTIKIKKSYESISDDVKNAPDALLIATFLNLH